MRLLSGHMARSFWLALCGYVLLAPLSLAAQDWLHMESAFIYNAEGRDFVITQRGERAIFPAGEARTETIFLERSGIVQTSSGTFLTIRFAPSGTKVVLSENTLLVYNGIDETGRFADLGLLYGRIRVVSGETGHDGIHSVVVRSGGVSSRLIEGDKGIDYILAPGGQAFTTSPLFRLFAFRGSAEVFPYALGGTVTHPGGAQTFTVEEGETFSLDISSTHTFAERGLLGNDLIAYWNLRGIAPAVYIPEATAVPEELPVFEPAAEQPVVRRTPRVNLWLGFGLGLMVSSVAVQGVAIYWPEVFPNDNFARNVHLGAYGPLGLGALFTLIGILRNPSPSAR